MKLMRNLMMLALIVLLGLPVVSAQDVDTVVIWSPGDNGTVADWDTDPILMAVEEATNTDIKMLKIDWGSFIDQVNAAAASGDLPDIIGYVTHTNMNLFTTWAGDGVIAPYEGDVAAAAPNVLAEYEGNAILNEIKIEGEIYGQPISWGDETYPNAGLIHIRRDLLDAYGLAAPDTFEAYFDFLRADVANGGTGVLFSAENGIGSAINAFAGAYGLPMTGWVEQNDGSYGYWAVQPGMKDALLLFRQMVAEGLVDPASWQGAGRDEYAAGQGASLIFNGGGHIGRIQNDMDLAGHGGQEWLLPALTIDGETRGYTTEPMFAGMSTLGGMQHNNTAAAARVINFLISDEGYKLTAVGVEGIDYQEVDGQIELLPARTERGFPTEAGDTGAHPMATTIVSWVPQEWQNWQLLYGKDAEFEAWFNQMWENQGMYQITSVGQLTASPLWLDFQATSNELISRAFLEIVNAGTEEEASAMFDQFVSDWNGFGGEAATAEMSALLQEIYS